MVDDAHHEEQRRLEQRVRQQHHRAGQRRVAEAGAERDDEQAELADRAVGQQQLQVMLAQRRPAAEEHGDGAGDEHDRAPRRGAGEHRPQQRDQEDPGLDHRRRVQVGADRRRRGHRRGQPEAEREDRRLGQRARPAAGSRRRPDTRRPAARTPPATSGSCRRARPA